VNRCEFVENLNGIGVSSDAGFITCRQMGTVRKSASTVIDVRRGLRFFDWRLQLWRCRRRFRWSFVVFTNLIDDFQLRAKLLITAVADVVATLKKNTNL